MLAENIKLLFKLYYRPASAMSEIIDRGNWLFGAALVTATAFLLAFTVTNRIYKTYEAAPVQVEERLEASEPQVLPSGEPQAEPDGNVKQDLEESLPYTRRLPLPVVGNAG
jgi:hypothetical protein